MSLKDDLGRLPPELSARLGARGFDPEKLLGFAALAGKDRDARNRYPAGNVTPPEPGDVEDAPLPGTAEHARLSELGRQALARGEVALCVLAGGMATRMGGVVKALVEALPGRTFLDLRLAEVEAMRAPTGGPLPLWLMTSEATDGPIREALAARAPEDVHTFEQFVSLRLTPEGELFFEDGAPSVYATGHGDLPDALKKSGLLDDFLARGGKTIWIANLDNLGATVDPAILGWHLERGADATVEVVDKLDRDKGGVPVRLGGKRIVAEEFRLPLGFEPEKIRVFNTNTFLVSASALASLSMDFTYVEVEKRIGNRKALQFERLLGEMTVALEPRFLRVRREGEEARFLPVKDPEELERRRPEIERALRARGILS